MGVVRGIIEQVSISRGGIPKHAIPCGRLEFSGISGDSWRHPKIHGGPDQAVLLITSRGITRLQELGFSIIAGSLGENLTVQGIDRFQMRLGQRYRCGDALLELTKVRKPCVTLNVLGRGIQKSIYDPQVGMGDAASPLWGLSGFYARVIQPGVIRAGDDCVLSSSMAKQNE